MSATIAGKKQTILGNKRITIFTVALDTYATNGVSVTPANLGMDGIDIMFIAPSTDGIEYEFDYDNNKIKAYRGGGYAASMVLENTDITVSGGDMNINGETATGVALQVSTATATGVLGKLTATDREIALATFGLDAPSAAFTTGPTLGTAQNVLVEVTNGVSLATAAYAIAIGT